MTTEDHGEGIVGPRPEIAFRRPAAYRVQFRAGQGTWQTWSQVIETVRAYAAQGQLRCVKNVESNQPPPRDA